VNWTTGRSLMRSTACNNQLMGRMEVFPTLRIPARIVAFVE
jgi:hypothetical protein